MARLLVVGATLVPVAAYAGPPSDLFAETKAMDDGRPLTGFKIKRWRMETGLPQNSVNGIAQDDDGFLWLATFGGLARFDGVRFKVFDPTNGLPKPRVVSIAQAARGGLWLGFEEAGFAHFANGVLTTPSLPDALRTAVVFQIFDVDGRVWAASSAGVFTGPDPWVWTSTVPNGRLDRWPDGRIWMEAELGHRVFADEPYGRWRIDALGLAYTSAGGVRPLLKWPVDDAVAGPLIDHTGALWLGVHDAAVRIDRRAIEEIRRGAALPSFEVLRVDAPIRELFESREGPLWIGTDGAGLYAVDPQPFRQLIPNVRGHSVSAVMRHPAGGYIVSSGCEGVTTVGPAPPRRWLTNECITTLAAAGDGTVIAGGQWGIWRFSLSGAHPEERIARAPRSVRALVVSPARDVWALSSREGLFCSRGGREAFRLVSHRRGLFLELGPDGALWLGGRGRLTMFRDGAPLTELTEADGLPPADVRSLFFDEGRLWIGTYGGGLLRYGPEGIKSITTADGLLDNFINAIVEDPYGRLWLNGNRGAFYVDKASLEAFAEGNARQVQSYGAGTEEANYGHPAFVASADRIAFPTIAGLAEIDLTLLRVNSVRPTAEIAAAHVDGRPVALDEMTEIPPGRGQFDVEFNAALLRAPERSSFEYRLRGIDAGWRKTTGERRAHYHHLHPGRYVFEVRAINADHIAGPPAAVEFSLSPHLHQTAVFRVGVVAALVALLWAGHWHRSRSIRSHNARLRYEVEQRAEAETALAERESHYRRVFESSVNGFLITDDRGVVVEANPMAGRILRCDSASLTGRTVDELPHGMRLGDEDRDGASIGRRADGTTFATRIKRTTYPVGATEQTLITIDDIDELETAHAERQRLREQLLHSQRVESVGRLAGGVAHDVNNMLTVVAGNISLAQEALSEGDLRDVAHQLRDVQMATEQTGRITRQLLAFARRYTAGAGFVDIDELLSRSQHVLRRLVRKNVEVDVEVSGPTPDVRVDPTHMEQVIMNLVLNASDAMPDGGRIVVRAAPESNGTNDHHDVRFVRLTVEDQGIGIPADQLTSVFEPFFTTKPFGEGTGLGLAVVHGIVTHAGGTISVDSVVGEGTRFHLLLPAAHRTA